MTSIRWGELTAPEIAAAARENALVLLPLGCTEQHAAHLPVDTDTYQVERCAIEGGFRRIVAVKGCGGHWAVPGAIWDVKAEALRAGREVTLRVIGVADDWRAVQERHFPGTDGGHAAVMETAL